MVVSILTFLIVLTVLVVIHELGHFLVARYFGIWVEEFGFGLPPKLFGKKIGETEYTVNALPFGGFVKLHAESSDETVLQPERAFITQSKLKRSLVIIAGVIMNFVLAVVAFAVVYSFSGIPKETPNVRVVDVAAESPAQTAGLLVGDVIRKVGTDAISSVDQFVGLMDKGRGKQITIVVERGGETKELKVTPRAEPPAGEGPVGVTISATEVYFPPIWQRPFVGVYYGFKEAFFWGGQVVNGFIKIFTDLAGGSVPKDLAGPVGIFAVTSEASKVGVLAVINFIGILSVNLAILNIIPFPALDGGRLLFIGIEALFGRKVVPKVEATIHTVGMVILLTLILAITARDIQKLFAAGSLSAYLESIVR